MLEKGEGNACRAWKLANEVSTTERDLGVCAGDDLGCGMNYCAGEWSCASALGVTQTSPRQADT